MKTFRVIVTDDAKADLKKYRDYILKRFKNPQAARDLILDFRKTRIKLQTVTEILQMPESKALLQRGLKRINFTNHSYFLLYRIIDQTVFITDMFHFLEDYENKLK